MAEQRGQNEFERGRHVGETNQRLVCQAEATADLKASVDGLIKREVETKLGMQHLSDQAEAAKVTLVATEKALKEAEERRLSQSVERWTPLQRLSLVVGIIGGLIVMYSWIVRLQGKVGW